MNVCYFFILFSYLTILDSYNLGKFVTIIYSPISYLDKELKSLEIDIEHLTVKMKPPYLILMCFPRL